MQFGNVNGDPTCENSREQSLRDRFNQAMQRLRDGNDAFMQARANPCNISPSRVKKLSREGQAPFACIVCCADSRVVPEHIFLAGLGELFCVRVAGNVVGTMELASCVYAAEHLGVQLIVVMGHTQCGAVASALEVCAASDAAPDVPCDDATAEANAPGNALAPLLTSVCNNIGNERDPRTASMANARAGARALMANDEIAHLVESGRLNVVAALYETETGKVNFLDDIS